MPVGIKLREQYPVFSHKQAWRHGEPSVPNDPKQFGAFAGDTNTLLSEQAVLFFMVGTIEGDKASTVTVKLQESHVEAGGADSVDWVDITGKSVTKTEAAAENTVITIGLRASELSRKYWRWHYSTGDGDALVWFTTVMFGGGMAYNPVTPIKDGKNVIIVD